MARPDITDVLKYLQGSLETIGLHPQILRIIGGQLALNIQKEHLTLPAKVRQQAFLAEQYKTRREILTLVHKIADLLRETLEQEAQYPSPGNTGPPRRPPPPAGVGNGNGGENGRNPLDAPKTPEEYLAYFDNFLHKNLGPFKFDPFEMKYLSRRAARVAKELQEEYELSDQEVATVTKTLLYDLFIVCDNSGSMRLGNRIGALTHKLNHVAHWATELQPDGISLRFMNKKKYDQDGLTTTGEIDDLVTGVLPKGSTRVGTVVRRKVIEGLKARLKERNGATKPRIILIITDGAPTSEDRRCLKDTILQAKTGEGLGHDYKPAATVFLIFRVGNDEGAIQFLYELLHDDEISSFVYGQDQPLDELSDMMGFEQGEGANTDDTEANKKAYEKERRKVVS
ncbi:hypothetical protein AbraIFM66950_006616 [Aspergillus brasiliensis]|nr:hypothetical protein AbraIFM66950_006616 [Aspergillus brasiliensis]